MIVALWVKYKIALLIGLAAAALAFSAGWKVREWKCDAALLAATKVAQRAEGRMQSRADTSATTYEYDRRAIEHGSYARQEQVRTIYRDRPVSDSCAVPDAARRLLVEAVDAANTDSPGQSGEQLPRAANSPADTR